MIRVTLASLFPFFHVSHFSRGRCDRHRSWESGEGCLVTPVLTLIFGVDIHLAIGASIIAIIATSSGGAVAYVRDRITNIRVGMFLEIGTTLGAITGAAIAAYANSSLLFGFFGVVFSLPWCRLSKKKE